MVLEQGVEGETERAVYGMMSPEEAAAYLSARGLVARGFGETLAALYPYPDLLERLQAFYRQLDPTANERSLTKKLQNWLADRNAPSEREELFRIAFALGLNEDQLDYLLGLTTDYCIQYRDGREMVLAWFLRKGLPYADALAFYDTLPAYEPVEDLGDTRNQSATFETQTRVWVAATTDELRACYLQSMGSLGHQHLRARYYFDRYLDQLMHPTDAAGRREVNYSIDTMMRTYLGLHMPASRRRRDLSPVQKLIKQGWPSASAIKRIRSHQADVPRKLLLLLYVVTENQGFADEPAGRADTRSFEQRVNDHWSIISAMLTDCGMAPLDMRNAFDWLVLYSVSVHDDEAMSDRMEAVIERLFG